MNRNKRVHTILSCDGLEEIKKKREKGELRLRGNKTQEQRYDYMEGFKQSLFCSQDKLGGGHCDNLDVIMPVLLIKIVLEANELYYQFKLQCKAWSHHDYVKNLNKLYVCTL